MPRRYRSPIALILTVTLAAPSGFAAPKPPKPKTVREELPDAARKDWDAARDLLDTSDFAGALVEYKRAYDESKNPRVLYNVAVCLKNLRHYARAEATFKQELTDGAGKISAAEEADVKSAIQALDPFVSTLEVTANETGATLLIDGEAVGQTPFDKPVPIDVGPHEVRLHKDGFVDAVQTTTIAGGTPAKAALNIDPAVKKATVSIAVTGAPGANVVIDGIDMGQAPFKGEVVAGRHTFEARAPGFVTARQTTDVVYKTPLNLSLDLAVERHEGKLRIEATPVEASIEVDGKIVGSGTWEGGLPSGGHQVIVKRPGFQPYTSEITISDDQSRDVKATLLEEKGGSNWVAWTIGAVLVVGGGAVAGYFAFQPNNQQPVVGDLTPGTVTTASYPGLAGVSGFRTVPGVAGFHTMPGPVGRR
ncbi:MAG: PEGA domain-containing protein [Polyangiaceae bacterium]